MKSVVVYDSQYGNTQALAEAIAAELQATGAVEVEHARTGTVELPSDLGLLIVGGPTQAHGLTPRVPPPGFAERGWGWHVGS